ncbi:hypothetical protein KC614_04285 [candidate division WWE3 bacterium]|uniref:Uncharacterized protein n=1 Tax=candidate division WWE3 bacterium TaxID=2053526 RepID=A0A955LKF5_UNCKA|nr:hypothetical protein [candidate division WWE3 bacterium]
MKTRKTLTALAVVVFLMIAVTAVAFAGSDVPVSVYQPTIGEDATCLALADMAADTNLDADIVAQATAVFNSDCAGDVLTWDVPADHFTQIPAGYTSQGDISVVVTGTEVISGGIVSRADMINVFKDSRTETGEVTIFDTDTWVYCQWGCDVFAPSQKSLWESRAEMTAAGCAHGCRTVYTNITGLDSEGTTYVSRMTPVEVAAAYVAALLAQRSAP